MTDYVKATNFASKDSLPSGNSLKIVKGTELNTEFDGIQTAVATKADLNSPTFIGTPSGPTASAGTSTTQVATTAFTTTAIAAALQVIYPVGCIYTTTVATNPATVFGFGTWVAYAAGRVMVGNGGGFSAGATGGSADAIVVSHTHSITDPGHTHTTDGTTYGGAPQGLVGGGNPYVAAETIGTATTGISLASAGSSGTNANLQPYVVVYMWNRTA
jgi:hypothetical protein